MKAPSDWEQGVLAAAKWLREANRDGIANLMLARLSGTDEEGTEKRVVKQIAQYIREQAPKYLREGSSLVDQVLRDLAEDVERGEWRPK